jgi:uncharacterized membrane protein
MLGIGHDLIVHVARGWLGGKLTYRFGVRVVPEDTQAEGYETKDERAS